MNFPQELIDEILSYLQSYSEWDRRSLRRCSLVTKSWINPSRRRLFRTVLIRRRNRRLWLDNISPSNTELLYHVRSFCFSGFDLSNRDPLSKFADIEDLYLYFPSFRQLHIIELCDVYISSDLPERIEMFSSCQQVLSSLILATVSLPWRSFIALIDYFPNLRKLELRGPSFEDDNINPPPLSRPLRGKLHFDISEEEYLKSFSNWFTGLEVEYEELVIDVGYVSDTYSQRIAATCGKTLKRLRVQSLGAPTSLLRYPELRELEFSVLYPTQMHTTTISSVTSTNIRKITFSPYSSAATLHTFLNRPWTSFDNCISALTDKLRKLGIEKQLEVEFRFEHLVSDSPVDYKWFLPKFREKGRVRVVDRSSGQVLELTQVA